VILDRPPNDPFLRKKEPFTSPFPLDEEAGVSEEAGILTKAASEDLERRKSIP